MSGTRSRNRGRQVPGLLRTAVGVTQAVVALRPPRGELPPLSRSYEPMRQARSLPVASGIPIPPGLCRLSPIPAGRWLFPTLLPAHLPWSPGPLPRGGLPVHLLVSSRAMTASRRHVALCFPPDFSPHGNFAVHSISGLQSFTNVQAPRFAWPPGCTYRRVFYKPLGSRALYTTQDLVRYLPQVVASLHVRIEQLT